MKKVTAYLDDKGKLHQSKAHAERADAYGNAIDFLEDKWHHGMEAAEVIDLVSENEESRDIFRKLINTAEKIDGMLASGVQEQTETAEEGQEAA